ncbi:MAG: hypothetical protein MK174_03350 [Acidimicrobiales bacterium]|nr:hypothetical protein [Acidimicrobiales bacterium]
MTHAGYLVAGWGISLVVLGGYAFGLVRRGRRLAPRVPGDGRRWIDWPGADGG